MPAVIESRTVDGRLFLAAADVVAALRTRAGEYEDASTSVSDSEHVLCYAACATELSLRADALDLAAIEHISTG